MRKSISFLGALSLVLTFSNLKAQYLWNSDSAFKAGRPNSGRIWGYAFGDYYYKGHSDTLNRGGSNQYTGIPQDRNEFQMRRIYLGYDYNISQKFSAEVLLAAEDNITTGSGTTSGDLLSDNKFTFYIKLANIRVKNIWKGTDLAIGQVATPTFPMISERIWNYRSIERTISDIRRTPSYDFGATLQGKFDPNKGNYGYDLMLGNGTSAKPENDNFKWLYGDVYAYFFNKKLVIDLYADYEKLNWTPSWHHSRQMVKGYIAYSFPSTNNADTSALTVGVEGFINNLKQDNFAGKISGGVDTLDAAAKGISVYAHGNIVPNKLRFFARFDAFNPTNNIDNNVYASYKGNTSNYNDLVTKEKFINVGLDYTPMKKVHFMPNVWYNSYTYQGPDEGANTPYNSHDLVYRLTFFFIFGK
jgi:hypothetical protein